MDCRRQKCNRMDHDVMLLLKGVALEHIGQTKAAEVLLHGLCEMKEALKYIDIYV